MASESQGCDEFCFRDPESQMWEHSYCCEEADDNGE